MKKPIELTFHVLLVGLHIVAVVHSWNHAPAKLWLDALLLAAHVFGALKSLAR